MFKVWFFIGDCLRVVWMGWQSSLEDFIDEEHGEPSSHEKY